MSVKVKTAELIGPALDWAVAMTGAVTVERNGLDLDAIGGPTVGGEMRIPYRPSTNWAQCGLLIDKYQVSITYHNAPDRTPLATLADTHPAFECGDTILIAACRAIVASKLGDEVEVPDALVSQ